MESASLGSEGVPTAGGGISEAQNRTWSTAASSSPPLALAGSLVDWHIQNKPNNLIMEIDMETKPSVNRSATKCGAMLLIILASLSAYTQASPALVHSRSLASPGEAGNAFKIRYGGPMGSGSLAGNLMTLRITAPHGSTISSITDNLSDSYTLGVSVDSGSGGWVTAMYYLAGAPAGITMITVTYSSSVADWHGAVMEYSGVATSSPVDGTCSNHSTTIACSTAITTTGTNDLVVASMIGLSGGMIWGNTMNTVSPGGSFFFDAADTQCSDADEEYVQPSAGSVTPSFTVTGNSESFNIVGMAFKAANAGTVPTGMYILHQQHVQINGPASSETIYFVSSGNLLVADTDIGQATSNVTISGCSPSNSFAGQTNGSLYPQYFYLTSTANFSTNLHCTVSTTQQGQHGILVIYDIVGAAASPFNALGPGGSGTGTTITNTVTPTATPGIVFASENTGQGPATAVGIGFIFDNTTYTGESDGGQMNNGDGWQHYFYTSASKLTFTWTQGNSSSYMQAGAIAFMAGPSANGPAGPAPPTGLSAAAQ